MKLAGIAVLVLALPIVLGATTINTITVSVTEDGEDYLLLKGNTLEWEHISLFANSTATVSGTDSTSPGSDFTNSSWVNGITGDSCSGYHNGTLTCPYFDTAHEFSTGAITLSGIVGNVSLTINSCEGGTGSCTGGGSITILDQPAVNSGTLVVDLNDVPDGGTHVFDLTLTWDTASTVPEPASLTLSAAGLVALGVAGWKRKRSHLPS